MGKAHSNAWLQAARFCDIPLQPVLKVACSRHQESAQAFADQWGWQEVECDWRQVIAREDVDIIDICLPPQLHAEVAIAAAQHGKHVYCEKPMALTAQSAAEMLEAVESNKVCHFLNHNYRRLPAIGLAKQMIDAGKLGTIYHWRACYQQDWILDPQFPLTWHLRKELAGSGAHADLNSHCIDLARYLVGEITAVQGLQQTFIHERPLPDEAASGTFSGKTQGDEMGKVTVDDCSLMQVNFDNGAVGSFEATRFAGGRKNHMCFEIYGSKGSITFDLERLNELQYYNVEDDSSYNGFRTILATEESHPYADQWWPPGHIIGYEHSHIQSAADFLRAVAVAESPAPNFYDGLIEMRILDAAIESAQSGRRVSLIEQESLQNA
ncbi:MAG: Gfo/Idh/MocA family oxidoreductase [Planctomycetes bacterium]|nr:Gfo/Idh/MocA family oxidoreductase [Planctomycetota bacterium]